MADAFFCFCPKFSSFGGSLCSFEDKQIAGRPRSITKTPCSSGFQATLVFSLHSLRPSSGTGCVCTRAPRGVEEWRLAVGGRADCQKTHDVRRGSRFSSRLVSVSSVSVTDGLRGAGLVHLPTSGVVGPWRSGCTLNAGPF